MILHFNKASIGNPDIAMWVLKAKGKTYYVEHIDCQCVWSTKETPNNPHTKGSIKVKNCNVEIDENNVATVRKVD